MVKHQALLRIENMEEHKKTNQVAPVYEPMQILGPFEHSISFS